MDIPIVSMPSVSTFPKNSQVDNARAFSEISRLLDPESLTQEKVRQAWDKFFETEWAPPESLLSCSFNTYMKALEDPKTRTRKAIERAQKIVSRNAFRADNEESSIELPSSEEVHVASSSKQCGSSSPTKEHDDIFGGFEP